MYITTKSVFKKIKNLLGLNKLNVSKLVEFRRIADCRYVAVRNTRIGGFDILDDGYFVEHCNSTHETKIKINEYKRNAIYEMLDTRVKKF